MDIKAFLKENAIKIENVKYVASERFLDENKKPIKWELRILSNKEVQKLRNDCTIKKYVKNRITNEIDNTKFTQSLITKCIVEPDINNVELQENYDVMGAYDLLAIMLSSAELIALENKVLELHNYEEKAEKEVDDIKN